MSADQELAATGAVSAVGFVGAGLLLIAGGAITLWRKIALRSANRSAD